RTEVGLLMELFLTTLQREVKMLHENHIRLRFIGDRDALPPRLHEHIAAAENLTRTNTGLTLVVAANYGGRWDVAQAARRLAEQIESGALKARDVTPRHLAGHLSLCDLPEPDLFIRTGGEQRISNFLLWQIAYTELYFTDVLWPDFDEPAFNAALAAYAGRQRRFGCLGEQVEQTGDA
ncbi:MAG: di-trans,poly-cis-decaprenylcistransferase, partial [Gammaproteobacteria bacterium]|nr:di-trans,poly-cis-decaprenylcistransferase [Gammaproteobacteria bacterium]